MFKFFPAPETRARILAHGELSDALFARLLAAYFETACDYGPDGMQLGSGHEPFKLRAEFEREIDALVACGYAERHGNMVKRTDRDARATYGEQGSDEPTPGIELSRDVLERVNELLQEDQLMAAVGVVAMEIGVSLVEAKTFVDRLRKSRRSE